MNNICDISTFNIKIPDHRIAISTAYAVTAITAVLLNSLVLYSIWKTPSLHKPSYILIANLALTDFITGAVAQPLVVITYTAILFNWKDKFCKLGIATRAIAYWMGGVSLFTITVISIDRLLAIRLKNNYQTVVTLKRITSVLIMCWIGVGIFILILLLSQYSVDLLVNVAATYIMLLLLILTVCYSMAFISLKKLSSSVSNSTTPAETAMTEQSNFNVNKYRRSFNTMLLLVCSLLLSYLPYVCSAITISIFVKNDHGLHQKNISKLKYKLLSSSQLIVLINSTVNPLLYLWRIKDLRQAVVTTLKRILSKQLPDNQEQQQPQP